MINNEILSFVKDRVAQGSTKEQISDMLVTHGGWDQSDVDEAFDAIKISGKSMTSAMNDIAKNAEIQAESLIEIKPAISVGVSENVAPTEATAILPTTSLPDEKITPPITNPVITKNETQPPIVSALAEALEKARREEALQKTPDITIPEITPSPIESPKTTTSVISPFSEGLRSMSPVTTSQETVKPSLDISSLAKSIGPKSLEPTVDIKNTVPANHTSFVVRAPIGVAPSSSVSTPPDVHPSSSIFPPQTRNFNQPSQPNSLDALRANFASGTLEQNTVIAEPVNPTVLPESTEPLINTLHNSFSPEKITVENTSPHMGLGLSPHVQSGMVPSGNINPFTPPPPPVFHPSQEIHTAIPNPIPTFTPTTKLPNSVSAMPHVQPFIRPRIEVHGRKLLATVTLFIGMVIGATVMHAYLNEYFDPLINWVKGEIPALSTPQT